ncbi:Glycine cleavage system transcriptional activator [Halomonas sp. THAF12]|uniref:LysR substrate-binding domain-containing protein n=1 Tax=Halomonas sp. THAF12 TaxID=2587849 RepID=UPI001267AD08|nr:LysR substrate-binding domain-containing protein [Halomonas sp. THAF12]QFT83942.1 Glycine cleavage system transcriptional activator [Halomonas sp. THAF12]
MHRSLPALAWLRTFEASARLLSFTAAADELALTPSSVSQHVRLLEDWLGEALFQRLHGGLLLTDAGAALLPRVTGALDMLETGVGDLFHSQRPRLTVRFPASLATMWLAPRLHQFQRAHPEVSLRISTGVWPTDSESITSELEVRHGLGNWAGYNSERLTHDVMIPMVAPSLYEEGADGDAADLLRQHQLLHVMGYERGWSDWMESHYGSRLRELRTLPLDSEMVAATIAESGQGVTLGRLPQFQRLIDSGRLITPLGSSLTVEEGLFLLTHAGHTLSREAKLFRDWLMASFEEEMSRYR